MANDPSLALFLVSGDVVTFAEQIDARDRSIESARLLVAARVFAGCVEIFREYEKQERK